jgi:hypothetical protein
MLYHVFNRRRFYLPARYKRASFWLVRFLLAMAGGALAVAYDVQTAILAMNIGASTPLIVSAFASGAPILESKMPDRRGSDRGPDGPTA